MTSIPPAEPRPPPLQQRRPTYSSRPSISRGSSGNVLSPVKRRAPALPRQVINLEEDRPVKRRKVEGDGHAEQASKHNNGAAEPAIAVESRLEKRLPHLRWAKPSSLPAVAHLTRGKEEDDTSTDDDLPDLPARPWSTPRHPKASTDEPKSTHRARVDLPVPNTPDSLGIPSSVPHFVPKRPAGFFPWTGKHPEDILSDNNVKHGYFDKPPNPTEKELNTARVPLYNAFKHKSGVDNLSVLFSMLLERKSKHGLISSVSTFKPPPRVTLTEAKRKSWITDLANADVPLRRLSRTIPQGIRGQLLLDQCLQSSVPLSRAIWFAKCVCANEIRTLKRKGTAPAVAVGTEGKWLREWTINVEHFLESQLAAATLPDWKFQIQYALRLVTRLYLENLLDRDHYLDWLIRSFSSADLEHSPFWLMMIHIYKQDLSYYRRRGRRLAEALLDKFHRISDPLANHWNPLRQRLRRTIHELLLSRPVNFLMPEKWPGMASVVRECINQEAGSQRQLLAELDRINERAMGFNRNDFSSRRPPDQTIVDILDSACPPYDLNKLVNDLESSCADTGFLIFSCLEWACSRFRQSKGRVYLIGRLVKRWLRAGHDVGTVTLDYLSACRDGRTTTDPEGLKHLVAQLSRSGAFPLSKYMQWLMVRGLPKKGTVNLNSAALFEKTTGNRTQDTPDASHLLFDLSLDKAEDHVINLRNTILGRAQFDLDLEESIYRQCVSYIDRELEYLGSNSQTERPGQSEPAFGKLPWSLRTRVSMWLRSKVLESVVKSTPRVLTGAVLLGSKMLKEPQFNLVRHILECMEDEAVLADVVGLLSSSQDDDLVAALASTIQFHADSFSALGALEVLQKQLCQVYMSWRATKPTMPLLTTALLDLCTAFPTKSPTVKLLQQDLVRGDRGRAVAACSPYSDGIAESLQQAGATFVEDFEAILQSEPNMNEQTMNGLFTVLADRIEKQPKFGDDPQTLLSFCQLLSRLRMCRRTQGDVLIQRWLSQLIPHMDGKLGSVLLRNLIGTGCVSFARLFDTMVATSKPGPRTNLAVTFMLHHIVAPINASSFDWVTYQTRTKWIEYSQTEPQSTVEILCESGLEAVSPSYESHLLPLVVRTCTPSSWAMSSLAERWTTRSLNRLLHCRDGDISGADLRVLLQSINALSHRFVQLRFWLMSRASAGKGLVADLGEVVEILSDALAQTIQGNDAHHSGGSRFSQLLQTVGSDVANEVRHKVENEFLEALPKFPLGKVTSPVTAVFPSDVQQVSSIVERAFRVCTANTSPSIGFMSHLIDKFSQLLKYVGNLSATAASAPPPSIIPGLTGPPQSASSMNPPQPASVTSSPIASTSEGGIGGGCPAVVVDYLRYMLQMVCLQRSALAASVHGRDGASGKQAQSEQVQLLVRMASIAIHPGLTPALGFTGGKDEHSKAKEVIDFAFDVIATIADGAGDEVKMICARLLKDKLHDVRLKYLFGSINMTGSVQVRDMGEGLQVVKEGRGTLGEWKPRVWEVLDNGSGKENETSLGLGLFGARHR